LVEGPFREGWEVLSFPAIAEQDEQHVIDTLYGRRQFVRRAGEALHLEREPLEVLAAIRATLGEYNFTSQYQQSPAPLEGGLAKVAWFKHYNESELPEQFDQVIQSWDTANKPSELADFSVCTTWGIKDSEITTFPSAKYDHQADSTAQALAWINGQPPESGVLGFYRREAARALSQRGFSPEAIAPQVKLSPEEVKQWLEEDRAKERAAYARQFLKYCKCCGGEIGDNITYTQVRGDAYHPSCWQKVVRGQ
jgi:hypothetical protein